MYKTYNVITQPGLERKLKAYFVLFPSVILLTEKAFVASSLLPDKTFVANFFFCQIKTLLPLFLLPDKAFVASSFCQRKLFVVSSFFAV